MSNLPTLTADKQREIENHPFFTLLLSGNIPTDLYALYLWEQRGRYEAIEDWLEDQGVFDDMPALKRYEKVRDDFEELWKGVLGKKFMPQPSMSTTDMQKRLKEIVEDDIEDTMQAMAHVFAMHGDLLNLSTRITGKVPGAGRMFTFDESFDSLRSKIDAKCTDAMADEAIKSMDLKLELFDHLWDLYRDDYPVVIDDIVTSNRKIPKIVLDA